MWASHRERKEANGEPRNEAASPSSHAFVIWTTAALGWNPGNNFVRIHDVAGFAVHAVRRVEVDFQTAWRILRLNHFVDVGRAEILAGVAELFHATLVADRRIVNHKVRRLIFLVLGSGVIEIGKFVERE